MSKLYIFNCGQIAADGSSHGYNYYYHWQPVVSRHRPI